MPAGVNVSRDLLWILTSNNNANMFKRKGIKKRFSTDPMNPKGVQTLRNSGLVQKTALSVEPLPSGKGIELVFKNKKNQNKPIKSMSRVKLAKNPRRSLLTIRHFVNHNNYRRDLKMSVLRRASALLRAQKPRSNKRGGKAGTRGKKAD